MDTLPSWKTGGALEKFVEIPTTVQVLCCEREEGTLRTIYHILQFFMLELDCAASPGDCAPSGSILPSLVLIGTRKAGTTALSNLLREHPRVLMPDCSAMRRLPNGRRPSGMCVWDKEVRYFSRGLRQHLDLCWYRSLYRCPVTAGVGRSMDASVQFHQGRESPEEEQYVGFDGSPDYLVIDENSVALMRSQLGSRTRLVALLRNPADRFYSAYNMAFNEELNRKTSATAMALARGGVGSSAESRTAVTYESFAKSLDRLLLCAPTCAAEPNVVSMFFNYGLYADHLAKFAKHFGWDRLLVERSEDFYADSATIALRVLRFAGLAVDDTLAVAMRQRSLSKEKRNAGKLWGGQAYTGKLQRAERRKLQAWFAPHNRRLYALIGRDLGWELDGENASSASSTPTVEDWAPGHVNKPAMALGQVEALPRPQAREAQLRPEL